MKTVLLLVEDPYLRRLLRYFIRSRFFDCDLISANGLTDLKNIVNMPIPTIAVIASRPDPLHTSAIATAIAHTWPIPIIIYGESQGLHPPHTIPIANDENVLVNFNDALHDTLQTPNNRTILNGLTPQDKDILRLIASGNTNKQIANTLGTTLNTINLAVLAMFNKFTVRSRAALATIYTLNSSL